MRADQEVNKKAPRYDGLCRSLSAVESTKRAATGEPFVIRQKMPLEGEIIVHDELRGDIKFKATDLDDQVLIKSNGIPTYQFASVVDDHLMKISHVTRGDEWLSSFPKNILLYQAFDWTPPKFIHLPLLLNKEGGKLSKRQGDVFVEQYRDNGYLPEAIINFCALLGWHPKSDKEIWSFKELKKEFSLKGLGISPAIFDLEKLDYFNGYYLRQKSVKELATLCRPYLETAGRKITDNGQLEKFVALAQDRMKKLADVVELTDFLFVLPDYAPELLCWKTLTLENARQNLKELKIEMEKMPASDWIKDNLEKTIMPWLKDNGKKNGDYLWPLRVSLTGLKNSPGPFEVAAALGWEESFKRMEKALK
jgi:glutamyl-tRNA synthetase